MCNLNRRNAYGVFGRHNSDQIIVAEVGTSSAGGLPTIRYQSGGLDEKPIRTLACNILEGGELAFRDRARRLRIALKR